MKENIIIVSCKASDEATRALKALQQKPEGKGFKISHGAMVKVDNGKFSLEDGFIADSVEGENAWTGGLIGALLGLVAGPLGALIGGGAGALLGGSVDKEALKGATVLLKKASECLVDGETALLLIAEETDESTLEEKLKDCQASIVRMDAKEIAAEIEQAEKKQK